MFEPTHSFAARMGWCSRDPGPAASGPTPRRGTEDLPSRPSAGASAPSGGPASSDPTRQPFHLDMSETPIPRLNPDLSAHPIRVARHVRMALVIESSSNLKGHSPKQGDPPPHTGAFPKAGSSFTPYRGIPSPHKTEFFHAALVAPTGRGRASARPRPVSLGGIPCFWLPHFEPIRRFPSL